MASVGPWSDRRRGPRGAWRLELAAPLELDEAQNDVAIALASAAQGAQFVEDVGLEPDEALAVLVGVALEAHRAERNVVTIASKAAAVMAMRIIGGRAGAT
jgi:hypothetical protein